MKPNLIIRSLSALLLLLAAWQAHADDSCFPHVKQVAEQLAKQPYSKVPPLQVNTGRITYDHYQHIKFRHNKTFWRDEKLPFQLEFMHPGMHFIQPVELLVWAQGKETPIRFSADYFDYAEVKSLNLEKDEPHMGFTGFRILSKLGRTEKDANYNETLIFQGASYFRALGQDQRHGLSGRGLSINTSLEGQEEFPNYTRFWLEKPAKDATSLHFCALLDSPSLAGATRFVLTPGKSTVMEVETQLYPRAENKLAEIGVAPLTSMFFHGENSPHQYGDYRPEVHDSDGLLIQQGKSWTWQALAEVPWFNLQSIPLKSVTGFGLLQRDRDFDHYQDLEAFYHDRPSVWVEPLDDWGAGSIQLLRLPTQSDIQDNIVAYWKSNQGLAFDHMRYKLLWQSDNPPAHTLGKVFSTRATNRAVDALPGHKGRIRFIIDFNDVPELAITPEADVEFAGKGQLKPAVVQENPYIKGWRVIAAVFPENCDVPMELRIHLTSGGNPVSETWSYPIPEALCHVP
ncbi:MAG: glucan biosynthesis protein [Gammaproteobacteria bacterium]|nr:glucan biosynthesis protein [Gammaproteobacteria bacterium]MBU1723386.1 glucan biosynthesis protein [Gammaproteobacteria bacterium]MBU2006968.1 glucan biosynthesis protein [Gammaproteobacteria bacterium]